MRLMIVEDDAPLAAGLRRILEAQGYAVGRGLGLAIVSGIAAGHGAALEIGEGAGAQGCRVAITFPHG